MKDVISTVFIKYFDDTMAPVSELLQEDKGLRLLPDKAVCFKRFLFFVTSFFCENLKRTIELRSEAQEIPGKVFVNAEPITEDVAERLCRTQTEWRFLREEKFDYGGIYIRNRRGTTSVLRSEDRIEKNLPIGK